MRSGIRGRSGSALLIVGLLLAIAVPSMAGGEVVQEGNLRVFFHGGIVPARLPRDEPTPIAVALGGRIATTDRTPPPKLERIVLELNAVGEVNAKGLPTCSLAKLESASAETAAKACATSLVGHGHVTSRVTLPGQGAFATDGTLQAFNASYRGKPAIFAQVASGAPLPLTYVIVFQVERKGGRFGTALIGTLPEIASEYGYISAFDLSLSRRFESKGETVGFAAASCPAPSGFTSAQFSFARAEFQFEDGRSVSSTLIRECKIRG